MPKQTMPLFEKYKLLSPGKKRLLKDKYADLFYKSRVFFYKLKNERPMTKAEQIFFNENL